MFGTLWLVAALYSPLLHLWVEQFSADQERLMRQLMLSRLLLLPGWMDRCTV
jgi:hypothetical protein